MSSPVAGTLAWEAAYTAAKHLEAGDLASVLLRLARGTRVTAAESAALYEASTRAFALGALESLGRVPSPRRSLCEASADE